MVASDQWNIEDADIGLFCKIKQVFAVPVWLQVFPNPFREYNDSLLMYIVKPVIILAASRLIFSKRSAFIWPQLSHTSQEYYKIGRINVKYILSKYSRSSLNLSFLRTLAIRTKIYAQVSMWGNRINLDIIQIQIRVKVAVSNTEYHYICFIWIKFNKPLTTLIDYSSLYQSSWLLSL